MTGLCRTINAGCKGNEVPVASAREGADGLMRSVVA